MRFVCSYRTIAALVFASLASLISQTSNAQAYPDRPVRLIAPFPPGGTADLIARTLAQPLTQSLGQPVIVENRAGAGGTIGAAAVAKAPPDGYTLLLGQSASLAFAPAIYKKLPYDAIRDFAPISLIGTNTSALVVHPSLPVYSVGEFIAYAKANPGKVAYASNGVGASGHFSGELFNSLAQVKLSHVPYKGGAPALADLLGGQVLVMFSNMGDMLQAIKAGKARALGVASSKRQPQLPDVPTIAEAGVPGFEVHVFFAVCAPAAIPAPVAAKLNAELVNVLRLAEMKERLTDYGLQVESSTPGELAAMIRSDIAKWTKVAQETGISAE